MHLGRSSRCRECHRAPTKDWLERNREQINANRRAAYRTANPLPERACVVCGRSFAKRPDAIVCGPRCRQERKRKQRRERDRKAAA
jgi:predicted nucleic acid-binding Zn ribbon protein